MAGLAAGFGSLALFVLLQNDSGGSSLASARKATGAAKPATAKQQDDIEKEEADELAKVEQMLSEELDKESNTPEFMESESDDKYMFKREFVLRVTRIVHKYHLLIGNLLNKQFEDKRLAAIESSDDIDYSRAYFGKNISNMRQALNIEDIIFDHFGIMEAQFEASNSYHRSTDKTFEDDIKKIRADLKEQVEEELGLNDE
eukprot:CAMPEP_0170461168 /NCGR_PEP_ID=MMETSP0123-20130129/7189_1 /TAXON_ID=182087 /ORGANISM="Favella ehrenbergii, Strain Fehren 1" /LENGTH=200 /DNA_ID=CAMNT_0010726149 /DNA_START=68 /DNA_END=670 /DNA_ORIENTATION=+